MRSRSRVSEKHPLWICPRCGARLVSRNLWHSCGRFTLASLFRGARPRVLALARKYVQTLRSLGDVQVIPQKSRLVCVARVRFGGLYPRKRGFVAAFALRRWIDSPRIVKTVDYGPRWRGHFVVVQFPADLDDELRGCRRLMTRSAYRPIWRAPDCRRPNAAALRSVCSRRRVGPLLQNDPRNKRAAAEPQRQPGKLECHEHIRPRSRTRSKCVARAQRRHENRSRRQVPSSAASPNSTGTPACDFPHDCRKSVGCS